MRNIDEVIRSKEQQLQQIQKELEALRLAAKLLAEESDTAPAARAASPAKAAAPQMIMRPAQPAAAPPVSAAKEAASLVAPPAWDVNKPQFP